MRLLAIGLLIGLSGCVSTQPAPLDTPEGRAAVNERAARLPATLHLDGEPARRVRDLRVDAAEATWTDRFTGVAASAPSARVRAVTFGAGRRSVLRGALIGAAAGVAIGAVAALDQDSCGWICFGPEVYIGGGLASGVLIGSAVGGLGWTRLDARPAAP